MIKLIWWIIKNIIWGGNIEADFSFMMSFTEAYEYLQKGYFIYNTLEYPKNLYFMIDGSVFCYNTKNKRCEVIGSFTISGIEGNWRVLPLTKQIKLSKKEDD